MSRAMRGTFAVLYTVLVGCSVGCSDSSAPARAPFQLAYTRWSFRPEVYLADPRFGQFVRPVRISGERGAKSPAWAPDGERLAFTRETAPGLEEIVVSHADGSDGTPLAGVSDGFSPAWSPVGDRIAFVRRVPLAGTPSSLFHIFVVPATGGTPVQLTTRGSRNTDPAWSPDGTRIAFISDRELRYDLFVMNADGTNVVRLQSSFEPTSPTWSPDGRTIAFAARTPVNSSDGTTSLITDIYSVNVDGSDLRRLTTNAGHDYDPAWSPDGSLIAYASERPGEGIEIYVMRPDGSGQRRVTPVDDAHAGVVAFEPAWRPRP